MIAIRDFTIKRYVDSKGLEYDTLGVAISSDAANLVRESLPEVAKLFKIQPELNVDLLLKDVISFLIDTQEFRDLVIRYDRSITRVGGIGKSGD